MKIGIVGASGVEIAEMKRVMAKAGHEVVEVCEADVKASVSVFCGSPLPNIGVFPEFIGIPEKDKSFRGGSRGKGGKIKYKRG